MIQHPERLLNCDPRLIDLVTYVGNSRDVIVIQGARTVEQEQQAIANGHSALHDPYKSKHVIIPDKRPLALAVDIGPYPLDWGDLKAFRELAADVLAAAKDLNLNITWGGSWTHLVDMPHFEIPDVA